MGGIQRGPLGYHRLHLLAPPFLQTQKDVKKVSSSWSPLVRLGDSWRLSDSRPDCLGISMVVIFDEMEGGCVLGEMVEVNKDLLTTYYMSGIFLSSGSEG